MQEMAEGGQGRDGGATVDEEEGRRRQAGARRQARAALPLFGCWVWVTGARPDATKQRRRLVASRHRGAAEATRFLFWPAALQRHAGPARSVTDTLSNPRCSLLQVFLRH